AEDGIRDRDVTGVQTCALPICPAPDGAGDDDLRAGPGGGPDARRLAAAARGLALGVRRRRPLRGAGAGADRAHARVAAPGGEARSEERRVGRESGAWGAEAGWQ